MMTNPDPSQSGSCLCGQIAFEVQPPSLSCSHCHCSTCRRAHGAAFVTFIGFRKEQVRILSGEDLIRRYTGETGGIRSFCGRCGSTLFYEGPRWPGEIHVSLSNLHGEADRAPSGHFYVDDRAPWWSIDDGLPKYGGSSGDEPVGNAPRGR